MQDQSVRMKEQRLDYGTSQVWQSEQQRWLLTEMWSDLGKPNYLSRRVFQEIATDFKYLATWNQHKPVQAELILYSINSVIQWLRHE